jgi:triacylglycerol lipase
MVSSKLILSFVIEIFVVGATAHYGWGLPVLESIGCAAAVIVTLRVVATLLSFVLSEAFHSPRGKSMHIGWVGWLRLVAAEVWAVLRVFFVLHPLEPWINKPDPDIAGSGMPVLLVHGFFSNGGYWWGIKRYLRRNGIYSVHTVNLEPPFCDIDELARQLARRVAEICAACGQPQVILVAHSMGGLVCRAYLQRLNGDRHTAKLITLGTPHAGTVHAHLIPGPNLRQMRPGNHWLATLNQEQGPRPMVPTTCIYSCHDDIVAPQDSGALRGAVNKPAPGVGHLEMTFSPVIQALLLEALAADA